MFSSDVTAERKAELFGKIARKIVDMRLTPVAIVTLESVKPLSFIGSQLMVFFQPIFSAVFPFKQYDEFAALLEERSNIEEFIQLVEKLEDDRGHPAEAKPGPQTPPTDSETKSVKSV
jgi:hypothetical protein